MVSVRPRPSLDPTLIQELRGALRGTAIVPTDPEYDNARHVWNGMIDKRPALIVRPAGAADVVTAVNFAREHELEIALRGGGHNIAGSSVSEGGLTLDFSAMKSIRVDPTARTARAEPGLTWGGFDRETQAFGLATTGGVVSTTGVAGLTLGGGIGWLMPKHGLASDNLRSVDIVTADGRLLRASDDEHADLFWAVRGGGGNFGVVTSLEFRLHPQGAVLGGFVAHPIERAGEMLRFYRELTEASLPDELATYAGLLTTPDGVSVGVIIVCYSGDPQEGERVIAPIRAFGPPIVDVISQLPYTAMQSMFDGAFPAGRLSYWKSGLAVSLSDETIDALVAAGTSRPSPYSAILIEHYHGAYNNATAPDTAYAHRHLPYQIGLFSEWDAAAESDVNVAWARQAHQALRGTIDESVYSNMLTSDEGLDRVRAAYGKNYDRLAELKKIWDPGNLFHVNQNIKPAG